VKDARWRTHYAGYVQFCRSGLLGAYRQQWNFGEPVAAANARQIESIREKLLAAAQQHRPRRPINSRRKPIRNVERLIASEGDEVHIPQAEIGVVICNHGVFGDNFAQLVGRIDPSRNHGILVEESKPD